MCIFMAENVLIHMGELVMQDWVQRGDTVRGMLVPPLLQNLSN